MKKIEKIMVCFLAAVFVLGGCGAKETVGAKAVSAIEQDLGEEIVPSAGKYCEEKKMIYVAFSAKGTGEDEAVLVLDEEGEISRILYQHIFDTIGETDYDRKKQYGDFTLAMYDVVLGDDRWIDVELK